MRLALAVIVVGIYPNLPDEYKTFECVNRGSMDLRPTDPRWP